MLRFWIGASITHFRCKLLRCFDRRVAEQCCVGQILRIDSLTLDQIRNRHHIIFVLLNACLNADQGLFLARMRRPPQLLSCIAVQCRQGHAAGIIYAVVRVRRKVALIQIISFSIIEYRVSVRQLL